VEIHPADTGPIANPGPPYALVEDEARPPIAAPLLGQHNAEVYCQMLGYAREQLVKLYQTGII
jgi:crotonobetainyl-CoA:carnitine CoA-transferase CaiB-like acyl-CoA transferase